MVPLRVVVVDDHTVFAEAIAARLRLEADFDVVGIARRADDADRAVRAAAPVIATVDVDLAGEDGLALVERWQRDGVCCAAVVVTAYNDAATAVAAVRAGAAGMVGKDASPDELVDALRAVGRGGSWLSPHLLPAVFEQIRASTPPPGTAAGGGGRVADQRRVGLLSEREREVLWHLTQGLGRHAIAARMVLSPNTVRTHIQRVHAKLEVHSSIEAVAVARRAQLPTVHAIDVAGACPAEGSPGQARDVRCPHGYLG